jgi:hypothetical protein
MFNVGKWQTNSNKTTHGFSLRAPPMRGASCCR